MLTDSIKFAIAKEFSEIKLEPGEESFTGEVILDVDVIVTKESQHIRLQQLRF